MIAFRICAVRSRSAAFIFCWSAVASPGCLSRLFTLVLSGLVGGSCARTGSVQNTKHENAKARVEWMRTFVGIAAFRVAHGRPNRQQLENKRPFEIDGRVTLAKAAGSACLRAFMPSDSL